MLWWKWELDAERKIERECGSIGAAQHSRSLTDIDPRPNPSQFPSYVVTSNYVLLHLESRMLQQRHPKTATVWWARIYAAHTVKRKKTFLGTLDLHKVKMCTPLSLFFYVYNPPFSVQMPEIPGVSVLLFVLTSPFQEKMNAFPTSPHPHPSFPPPAEPAESCCLGGRNLTAEMHEPRRHFWCVFSVCVKNHIYIQYSSLSDPSSVSYYTQGYTEKEPLCLNDSSYFNKDKAPWKIRCPTM